MLWQIIKSNWKIPIYLFFLIIGFIIYWNKQQELNASKRRERNLKVSMLQRWRQDKLALVTQAEVIDSLEGVLLSVMEIKIKPDTVTITTKGNKEGDFITFRYEDDCYDCWGWLDTRPPYPIEQYISNKPYSYEILITDLPPDVYGKITPLSKCAPKIENVKWKVSPNLKGACRDGFDKGEFILGGVIALGGVLAYVALR
jgi:hypothetical protein